MFVTSFLSELVIMTRLYVGLYSLPEDNTFLHSRLYPSRQKSTWKNSTEEYRLMDGQHERVFSLEALKSLDILNSH